MISKGGTIRLRDREKFNKVRELISVERERRSFRRPNTDGHALDLMLNMLLDRFMQLQGNVEWGRLQDQKRKAQQVHGDSDRRLQKVLSQEAEMRERFLMSLPTGVS